MTIELQPVLAALCGVSFLAVWAGLATQVVKIARRGVRPPQFHPLLQALHGGRFAGWAWTGAAALAADPITAWLLLATRVPATGLVALTFLQRTTPRPSAGRVAAAGGGSVAFVGVVAWGIAAAADQRPAVSPRIEVALTAFVLTCFAAQLLWALPRQIAAARRQPLGNLRWFQLALLSSYGTTFAYAFSVRAEWIQWIMLGVYGVAFVEQGMLVLFIERGMRAKRAGTALEKRPTTDPEPRP